MTREEAIKILREIHDTALFSIRNALETLIPELRESEDERIRKALIDGVRQIRCKNGITQEQMIAYLEKQKPTEYLSKRKVYDIMNKLTELSISDLIPVESKEYVKIHEIASDVCGLLDYPIEQKPAEWNPNNEDVILFNKAVTTNPNLTPSERAKLDIIRMKFKHCNGHIATNDFDLALGESYIQGYNDGYYDTFGESKPIGGSEKHIADIFEKVGLAKIVREQGNDNLTNAV